MDPLCRNISLGLYQQEGADGPRFLVHTYSAVSDAPARVAFIGEALRTLAGLEEAPEEPGWLRFSCRQNHLRALKRGFLDLCKLENGASLKEKPLTRHDKKADGELTVHALGRGVYEVISEEGTEAGNKRTVAVARGFAKLCEMNSFEEAPEQVAFPCGCNHQPLMGLLFFRAQNVRAAMKEEEMAGSRGRMSAPSQQT